MELSQSNQSCFPFFSCHYCLIMLKMSSCEPSPQNIHNWFRATTLKASKRPIYFISECIWKEIEGILALSGSHKSMCKYSESIVFIEKGRKPTCIECVPSFGYWTSDLHFTVTTDSWGSYIFTLRQTQKDGAGSGSLLNIPGPWATGFRLRAA